MSLGPLEIAVIVIAVLIVVVFVGGMVGARRRDHARGGEFSAHVAAADEALETARASDRGWDRPVMEQAVRSALQQHHPQFGYDELHLVHVGDAPGTEGDHAHFVAVGPDGERRVVLTRTGDGWAADRVE
jgi:hypothetical protein